MSKSEVRVRFAPSPTGYLHVGGARTALFNWLFARRGKGKFILRIEDTDRERSSAELEDIMLDDMRWLGLDWDEGPGTGGERGPYRQSERLEIYREFVDRLVETGKAYPCFCTDDALSAKKKEMMAKGMPPRYDGTCRGLGEEEVKARREDRLPESVRFIVDEEREEKIDDIIRGEVVFPAGMVGDFVILRSNGLPTYNFAVAVDDALMKITHVIRGEEHLSNTLRQLMIYRALDMEPPDFAHIPLILGPDRAKLSKRHGAPNIKDYRKEGYPPDAVANYLAMLGWSSPEEKEILDIEEMIGEFTLDRVSESPSIFDKVKMRWVCAQHIRAGKSERYLEEALPYFPESFRRSYGDERIKMIFDIISENLSSFSEIAEAGAPFAPGFPVLSDEAREYADAGGELFAELAKNLSGIEDWNAGNIAAAVRESGKNCGLKGKGLYFPLRAVLTGEVHGPDLSSVILIKGKELVLSILERAGGAD